MPKLVQPIRVNLDEVSLIVVFQTEHGIYTNPISDIVIEVEHSEWPDTITVIPRARIKAEIDRTVYKQDKLVLRFVSPI